MFLPIIQNDDLFDFQKSGNFNNWKIGITPSPNNAILPFKFKETTGGAITIFNAYKVKIVGKDVVILDTIDLISYKPSGTLVYETSLQFYDSFENGIYYLYLSDGIFEVKSGLFCCSGINVINPSGIGSFDDSFDESFEV